MKHKYLLISILFIFVSSALLGQKATLQGVVKDKETGETLIGVNVLIGEGGGTTDVNGQYSLTSDPGSYQVRFKYIGYKEKKVAVNLAAGETKNLDILLEVAAEQLDMVVVSAGKFEQKIGETSVSMEVIKPQLIENKNTISMETILDQVPGVNVMEGQVSIRGGSGFAYGAGSRVLVMVDDIPMLTADAGDVKWNSLPIENIEQIEVIKGAASVLFGSSALNGAINVRTAFPKDKPQTRINLYSGVYDNPIRNRIRWWDNNPFYSGFNFFHSEKLGNFDLVVGGNALSDQTHKQLAGEQRARINSNMRYRSKSIEGLSYGLNMNVQRSQGGLFIVWQDQNNPWTPLGGIEDSTTSVSKYTTLRANFDPYVVYYNKKGDRLSLRNRFYRTQNLNNTGQDATADMYYSEFQYQKNLENGGKITMGGVGIYSDVNSELFDNHYGVNAAAFAQYDNKFFDRLNVSFGMRAEYFRIDTFQTVSRANVRLGGDTINLPAIPVFRAGTTYQLLEETYIRASGGQGYRFPTIAEKFVFTSVGSLNIFPNPQLEPERGWNAEVGVKQGVKLGNWAGYLDVAAFWTEYRNMMEFTFGYYPEFVPPGLPPLQALTSGTGFSSQNVQNARINGVDISFMGGGKLGKTNVTIFTGYTYMNPVSLSTDSAYIKTLSDPESNMLKYRFNHLFKADVQIDYKKWSTGVSVRYNSYMYNIDRSFEELLLDDGNTVLNLTELLGEEILPGLREYREERKGRGDLVFDYRISYQTSEQTKAAIIVNNVLNREYMPRPGDIAPPRTIGFQFTLSF
jgi:outer membrane receptor protein involved in Fe transport